MQRSSVIATVVAAGGVLIAGSVASVAVINAAATNSPQSSDVSLVADSAQQPAAPASTPAAAPTPTATSSATAAALEEIESSELPVLPEVDDTAAVAQQPAAQPAAQQQSGTQSSKPKNTPKPKPSATETQSQEPVLSVSQDQAARTVMDQGKGVSLVAVSQDTRKGLSTWAVRITRSNGEVLTGYVDRESGIVVEWVVNQEAPTPSATATYDDDDDSEDGEDDNSGHGGDDDDESEDEGDDD